jgi:hypothetical protein
MIEQAKERLQVLCEQVASEQDPRKLIPLFTEINRLLKEEEIRLREKVGAPLSTESPLPQSPLR